MLRNTSVDSAAPAAVQIAETAFGKPISIQKGKDGRMFLIHVGGGGEMPPLLSGFFTRWNEAEDAIKRYLDTVSGRYVAKPRPALRTQPGPAVSAPVVKKAEPVDFDQMPLSNAEDVAVTE